MNAPDLVAALESAGARLYVVSGRIDLEAASEPPRELLDALTKSKADVLAFLLAREAQPSPVRVLDRRDEVKPDEPLRVDRRLAPPSMRSDERGQFLVDLVTGRQTAPAQKRDDVLSVIAAMKRAYWRPKPAPGYDAERIARLAQSVGFR